MEISSPVTMSVLSPHSLVNGDRFLASIKLFLEHMPELMPEMWGWTEPAKAFDANRLEELIPTLAEHEKVASSLPDELQSTFPMYDRRPEPISWIRRTLPKAYGVFSPRWGNGERATHSRVYVDTEFEGIQQEARVTFLKEYSVKMDSDLGHIDVLTPYYKEIAFRNGASQFADHVCFTTHVLRHWLPDIFWATVFGPPYVALFGKENLLNASCATVEEIAENMIYVQLTDQLSDAVDHPAELDEARKAFKRSLAVDAFYRDDCGVDCHDILDIGIHGNIFATPNFDLRS